MTNPNTHVESIVAGALNGLPDDASESMKIATASAAATTAAGAIPAPSPSTTNILWTILVGVLGLLLIGSLAFEGIYALMNKHAAPSVVLTIFTTSFSGLLGLFIKSPTSK